MTANVSPADLPILSTQAWHDLEIISRKSVSEAIESASKHGSTPNLRNALEAGCACGADNYSRAETIVGGYIGGTGTHLDLVMAWIDAYVRGPVGNEGVPVAPGDADRLLWSALSLAVASKSEHSLVLVEELIARGADSGLRDREYVPTPARMALAPFYNAVSKGNIEAVELMLGRQTVYDQTHPLPFVTNSEDNILCYAVSTLGTKPEDGARLFNAIARHLAPGHDQPYHDVFDSYIEERLNRNCSPNAALSFARGLLLGVRPRQDQEKSGWDRVFRLECPAPSVYPGSERQQTMPFVHALIAAKDDYDLVAILRHLHKHGMDTEQGCGSANVTPLVHAASKGKIGAVEALLDMDADTSVKVVGFDQRDPSKWLTPAEVALVCDQDEIAKMIFSHTAKKAIRGIVSRGPLHQN